MKFGAMERVYGWVFNAMLGSYYKKHLPERDIATIKRTTMREYRAMVERTPGLPKGNILAANLIMACYFFALPKADPAMTPELLDTILTDSLGSPLMRKLHAGKKKRGELFTDKHQNRRVAEAEKSQTSEYEMDWRYEYVKGNGEFWCTYTVCGLCTLAQREGMQAYLPPLCKSDYLNYELAGAKLYRTKTLAAGDDCCNFHVTRVG